MIEQVCALPAVIPSLLTLLVVLSFNRDLAAATFWFFFNKCESKLSAESIAELCLGSKKHLVPGYFINSWTSRLKYEHLMIELHAV